MSGIAEVLLNLGYSVTGSDLKVSEITERLSEQGATIHTGPHRAENVKQCDVVVISSAVKKDNPEVLSTRALKIPVIPRAEMLAELMRLKYGIAIGGSHGKTTTTSMIATVLAAGGLDPTAVVGGKLNSLGSNAKLGKSELMVVEADESDGSFLKLSPAIAIITNIDPEHMDHYGTLDKLKNSFVEFANIVPFYGMVVMCLDHPNVQALLPHIEKRVVTYGFSAQADYRLANVKLDGFMTRFKVYRHGEDLGEFAVQMVGRHNAQNALAAVVVADEMRVPLSVVRESLSQFGGIQRRFTVRGEVNGITVIDDYGHHPSEIRATIKGAKEAFDRRIVVAFQPHRYTRTHLLMDDFATAFNDADLLFVTEVYAAGEIPIAQASGERMVEAIRACGHHDVTFVSRANVVAALNTRVKKGDLVLTLGAGDISNCSAEFLAYLKGASCS